MKEYLEQVMHQSVDERPFDAPEKLPLGCRNAFELNIVKPGQREFLLAAPVEDMNLTELRKSRIQLERYTGYPCAFYLKKVNWYAAPKMVEEGIPFVWENRQVYLPFPGMLLQESGENKAVDPLSLTLMLSDEELDDPCVESCVEEMLEELVW